MRERKESEEMEIEDQKKERDIGRGWEKRIKESKRGRGDEEFTQ